MSKNYETENNRSTKRYSDKKEMTTQNCGNKSSNKTSTGTSDCGKTESRTSGSGSQEKYSDRY